MLRQEIEKNFQEAVKAKREIEVSTLRMLRAAILDKERNKRYSLSKEGKGGEVKLSDDQIIQIVMSEIKKRKESLALFRKGGREDLAARAEEEMMFLKKYLPEQISPEEIKNLAREVIKETGAKGIKDMGQVMSQLTAQLKGKAEGGLVSKIVRGLFSE